MQSETRFSFLYFLCCQVELHGLKNSSRGTREMVVVDQSWLIGLSEKRRETQKQRDESSYWGDESYVGVVAFGSLEIAFN